ncbi:MAG: hypothetical protein GJ680_18600 [Alteromonadaceae bacterium]|nr:hypothetical protein [Alteromonadaceae bacterium]
MKPKLDVNNVLKLIDENGLNPEYLFERTKKTWNALKFERGGVTEYLAFLEEQLTKEGYEIDKSIGQILDKRTGKRRNCLKYVFNDLLREKADIENDFLEGSGYLDAWSTNLAAKESQKNRLNRNEGVWKWYKSPKGWATAERSLRNEPHKSRDEKTIFEWHLGLGVERGALEVKDNVSKQENRTDPDLPEAPSQTSHEPSSNAVNSHEPQQIKSNIDPVQWNAVNSLTTQFLEFHRGNQTNNRSPIALIVIALALIVLLQSGLAENFLSFFFPDQVN